MSSDRGRPLSNPSVDFIALSSNPSSADAFPTAPAPATSAAGAGAGAAPASASVPGAWAGAGAGGSAARPQFPSSSLSGMGRAPPPAATATAGGGAGGAGVRGGRAYSGNGSPSSPAQSVGDDGNNDNNNIGNNDSTYDNDNDISTTAAAAAGAGAGASNGSAAGSDPSGTSPPTSTTHVFRPDPSDVVIRAVNVHKTYLLGLDGVPALRGVNLAIARGEFIVILGKSGGGKTSLLNVLGTIDRPSKGELYLAGRRITSATGDEEFSQLRLRHLGFVFQQFNLISTRTALENVALPMVLDGRLPASAIDKRAQFLLDKVGIGPRSSHLPSQLSGGEQQRVTIARAIANCPDILLLDEPTGDLDSKNSHIILSLLVELNRREGITCIMVTHDNDLRLFAHRVVHMMDGKILRTEIIPQATRDAHDARLRQQLEADALDTAQLRAQQGGVTEVRETGFYAALRPVPAEGNTAENI